MAERGKFVERYFSAYQILVLPLNSDFEKDF